MAWTETCEQFRQGVKVLCVFGQCAADGVSIGEQQFVNLGDLDGRQAATHR